MLMEDVRLKHRLAAIWPHPNPPGEWHIREILKRGEVNMRIDWWKHI
jgi:hypothetical protein